MPNTSNWQLKTGSSLLSDVTLFWNSVFEIRLGSSLPFLDGVPLSGVEDGRVTLLRSPSVCVSWEVILQLVYLTYLERKLSKIDRSIGIEGFILGHLEFQWL